MTSLSSDVSSRAKILLLGDSLTQTSLEGWGGALAHRYQRRADVLNRGASGYNTRWYLELAQTTGIWEESGNIVLVTIFFGANDASLLEHNPMHHVPLTEFQNNLKALASFTQKSYPNAKILFITPPPVHHGQRLEYQKQRYGDKATGILERTMESAGKYAEAVKSVGKDLELPVLDLFQYMNDAGDIGRFFYDGLHFNKIGHDFVLEQLLAAIHKHYKSIHVEPDSITGQPNNSSSKCDDLPSSGPYHDQIDYKNHLVAFQASNQPDPKRSKTE